MKFQWLICLGFMPIFAASDALGEKMFKIGVIAGLANPYTKLFTNAYNGVELAAKKINSQGGIKGRKIEVILRNDKLNPSEATVHAQALAFDEKVDVILVISATHICQAMANWAKTKSFLTTMIGCKADSVTRNDPHPYKFRLSVTDVELAKGMVAMLEQNKYKRAAAMYPNYEYGHAMKTSFLNEFMRLNPKAQIVADVNPQLKEKKLFSYVTKLMQKKPDLIFDATAGGQQLAFFKELRRNRNFKKGVTVVAPMASVIKGALKNKKYDGFLFADFAWYDPRIQKKYPEALTFAKSLKEQFKVDPDLFSSEAYLATHQLKELFENAPTPDQKGVIALTKNDYRFKNIPWKSGVLRACDRQVLPELWYGSFNSATTRIENVQIHDGSKYAPTCAEVKAR